MALFRMGKDDLDRYEALLSLTCCLAREVEALRAVLLNSEVLGAGVSSAYKVAWKQTTLLSHCSVGPSSGWQKLLSEFGVDLHSVMHGGRVWDAGENQMMERLGFSSEEAAEFRKELDEQETLT